MNADKRRYNAANLRSFAFICGLNSPIYLAGDYKLILTGYSQVSPLIALLTGVIRYDSFEIGDMMSRKRQVCFTIEEDLEKQMEEIRVKTGIPVSKQIEMRLKGYEISKMNELNV